MTIRYVLFACFCVAALAAAQVPSTVSTVAPADAPPSAHWLVFGGVWAFLTAVLGPLWYGIRRAVTGRRTAVSILPCIRQAGLAALVGVLALFFRSIGVLSAWDVLPLVVSAVLIELFFQSDTLRPVSASHGR